MIAAALVLVAVAVVAHRFWPHPVYVPVVPEPSLLEQRVKEELIVTLKTGEAFRGVLFELDESVWVLRNARLISTDRDGRPTLTDVDGEVVVLVESIAYCQRT